MTACTSCGQNNAPDAQFCVECGEYLGWASGGPPAADTSTEDWFDEPAPRDPPAPPKPVAPTPTAPTPAPPAPAPAPAAPRPAAPRPPTSTAPPTAPARTPDAGSAPPPRPPVEQARPVPATPAERSRPQPEQPRRVPDPVPPRGNNVPPSAPPPPNQTAPQTAPPQRAAPARPRPPAPAAPRPASPPRAEPAAPPSDLARVARALDKGRQLAERHDRPDLGNHLEQARKRLGEQVLGVAVVGEFKRGKSTLVNALLQTDVCPTDADIVTAVPTVVRYGAEPSAAALLEPVDGSAGESPEGGTVEEPVDVDRLADLVSEAADASWRRRLRSVEVRLPHRLLKTGLSLVDTPGVGGLESAHGIVTLGALRTTSGVIFVTDASQELTAPEVDFLRQALERCPAAVCVVTKTDLYPAWRRIVDLDRQHLANAGIDLPMIPVSSFLRLRAWRSPALNEESGFGPLFDWLRAAVLEAAAKQAVAAATRDLDFAQEQLRLEVVAEQQVLAKPEASAEVVGALRRRSERTRQLVERGNGWQQFLFDGIDQLIADVKHDLAGRMRTVVRDVEAVIDQGDPKETWPDIEVWLQRQVVRAANENHELLNERAAQLAADVAETFALESDEPLQLGLTAPVDVLRGLTVDPAQLAAPDSQKLVRMLFAGRAALIPVTLAGSAAGLFASSLLVLAAAPVVAVGVGFIGRKLIRDERQRQLTYRRQQAKMSCRRYLDEANFVIEKDCLDSLRRTRRELRDEFQARAGVLHASSQRALSSAERAATLSPQEREQRAAQLAARRAEIERLGKPPASRGAA